MSHQRYEKLENGKIRCRVCGSIQKSQSNFRRHTKTKKCQDAEAKARSQREFTVRNKPKVASTNTAKRTGNQGVLKGKSFGSPVKNDDPQNPNLLRDTIKKEVHLQMQPTHKKIKKLNDDIKQQKMLIEHYQKKTVEKFIKLEKGIDHKLDQSQKFQKWVYKEMGSVGKKLSYVLDHPGVLTRPPNSVPPTQSKFKASGVAEPSSVHSSATAAKKDTSGASYSGKASTYTRVEMNGALQEVVAPKRNWTETNEERNQLGPKRMRE